MKAIAAVKADESKALEMFNKGEGGFRDRDLYVFCVNVTDGTIVATGNPNLKPALGTDIRAAQNSTGKALARKSTRQFRSRKVKSAEVSFIAPKPGADDTLAPKVNLVARADADLGCGVGYYK